jgi:hypothetical protein
VGSFFALKIAWQAQLRRAHRGQLVAKIIYQSTEQKERLPALLEGYLYGLGETCHVLFGAEGEAAIYEAIGRFFTIYLKDKLGMAFSAPDPWHRYCQIIEAFTSYGFYSYVELEKLSDNAYWMLETGQYAGNVWEEQKAWERGTPPCPLWSIILYSLSEIDYKVVLDHVSYQEECGGYESTFHFERILKKADNPVVKARETIRTVLIPICSGCKKIRDDSNNWVTADVFFTESFDARFTHGICSTCLKELYPEFVS